MTTRLATFGLAGLLLAGLCAPAATARDFSFNLSIGRGDRCYVAPTCYTRSYYRDCDYDDCGPVVVRPAYRYAYYSDDYRPAYYRTSRYYSSPRAYYVSSRSSHRSVSVDVGRRGGRVYYRH